MSTATGNEQRPAWYAYVRDCQQRRQDTVAAIAREAEQDAPDPIRRVKDGQATRVRAEMAFDAAEPELSYDEFKAATACAASRRPRTGPRRCSPDSG